MDDLISRQMTIDVIEQHKTAVLGEREWNEGIAYGYAMAHRHLADIIKQLPAQADGWLEQNKDKILQAGMEGREIDFHIGGRLFAIREKAQ